MTLHPLLLEKLNAAASPALPPPLTRRDTRLPAVPGKAHAVIGMRRAGKQATRREGVPPERALYISFDDDRIADLELEQIRALAERKPEGVVCLDARFSGNDQLKANAVQLFKTLHRAGDDARASSDVTVFRTV